MFDKFPWTNGHQLNLDWVLRILKQLQGGTVDQVLTRKSNKPFDFGWKTMSGGGGGGGTTDYNDLGNKPSINNVTLQGDKTLSQLGIQDPPEPADTLPKMDGTVQIGSSDKYAKADHVHPSDTSRPARSEVASMIHRATSDIYIDISDLQNQIGDLSDLATTDKSNLVAAINEAAQSGGGGSVTPEEIQEAVDTYLDNHPGIIGTFTNAAKDALLSLLEQLAYINDNGQNYITTLRNELFTVSVDHITAVFTQGAAVIYTTDSLETLKQYLVVTAYYEDSTSAVVEDYTLSGTLEAGTSTITVSYRGSTDTFNVTVTSMSALYDWDFTNSLTDIVNGRTATLYGATQDSSGVTFDAAAEIMYLGEIFPTGKAFEIDISSFAFAGNSSYHARLFMNTGSTGNNAIGAGSLIFRSGLGWSSYGFTDSNNGHTGSQYRKWSDSGWGSEYNSGAIDDFNGHTIRLEFDSDMHTKRLYIDGVLITTDSSVYFNGDRCKYIYIGGIMSRTASSGDQCYNMIITGIRVYPLT